MKGTKDLGQRPWLVIRRNRRGELESREDSEKEIRDRLAEFFGRESDKIARMSDDFDEIEAYEELEDLPEPPVLDEVARFIGNDKALEVGAGSGVLASALAKRGVDIVATDDCPGVAFGVPVEPMMAHEAVARYADRSVLVLAYVRFESSDLRGFDDSLLELVESAARALESFRGSKIVLRTGRPEKDLPWLAELGFRAVRSLREDKVWLLQREGNLG